MSLSFLLSIDCLCVGMQNLNFVSFKKSSLQFTCVTIYRYVDLRDPLFHFPNPQCHNSCSKLQLTNLLILICQSVPKRLNFHSLSFTLYERFPYPAHDSPQEKDGRRKTFKSENHLNYLSNVFSLILIETLKLFSVKLVVFGRYDRPIQFEGMI